MNRLERERRRLIDERNRSADVERRSWTFTLQHLTANVAFALTAAVPHADRFFGPLTARLALTLAAPGALAVLVSVWLFRRRGPDALAYEVSEAIEAFLLYSTVLVYVYLSAKPISPFYILPPFTSVFWAVTKPFFRRRYGGIIGLSHMGLAVADVTRGDVRAASVAIAIGLVTYLTFESIARRVRFNVNLEVERNVVGAELNERLLEQERMRIGSALREGVGREIARLAEEIDEETDAPLRDVLADLESLASTATFRDAPRTLVDLARRLDDKCRPLCVEAVYASTTNGEPSASVDPSATLALVRVAQELVRNAVVHGRARHVRLALVLDRSGMSLVVADDGTGLSREAQAQATGGLQNARSWLTRLGGSIELTQGAQREWATGTELRAHIPIASRHP